MALVLEICLPYLSVTEQLKVMPGLQGICPSYSWVEFQSISPQFAEPECTWWFHQKQLAAPQYLPFYNLLGLDSHVVLQVTSVVPVVVDVLDVTGKHFYALSFPCSLTCDSPVSGIPYHQVPTAPCFVKDSFVWRLFLTSAHHLMWCYSILHILTYVAILIWNSVWCINSSWLYNSITFDLVRSTVVTCTRKWLL